jgi:nucleoid-associated protein YgaU
MPICRMLLPLASLACLAASCTQESIEATNPDGVLVLELGGAQTELGEDLVRAGVQLLPQRKLSEIKLPDDVVPEVMVQPVPEGTRPEDEPRKEPAPDGATGPEGEAPSPETGEAVVILGKGQTLFAIAKKHLGSATRYKEILKHNGWTEAQAKRLPPGTKVKLPPRQRS